MSAPPGIGPTKSRGQAPAHAQQGSLSDPRIKALFQTCLEDFQAACSVGGSADPSKMSAYASSITSVTPAEETGEEAERSSTKAKDSLFLILEQGNWQQLVVIADFLRRAAEYLKPFLTRDDLRAVCEKADTFPDKRALHILLESFYGTTWKEQGSALPEDPLLRSKHGKETLLLILNQGNWQEIATITNLLRGVAEHFKTVLTPADKKAVCDQADKFQNKTALHILCAALHYVYDDDGPD